MMQIYYSTLDAISQQTMQLDGVACLHCGKREQLVSHGFVYKKQAVATSPVPVGKRVLCSQRFGRTGCGRTVPLYLASIVRYLHGAGQALERFVVCLLAGMTITLAYRQISGRHETRQAYRWFNKLFSRLSDYRRLMHRIEFTENVPPDNERPSTRRPLLIATLARLLQHFSAPLCATYQRTLQTSFL